MTIEKITTLILAKEGFNQTDIQELPVKSELSNDAYERFEFTVADRKVFVRICIKGLQTNTTQAVKYGIDDIETYYHVMKDNHFVACSSDTPNAVKNVSVVGRKHKYL